VTNITIQKDGQNVSVNPRNLNFVVNGNVDFSLIESPSKTAVVSITALGSGGGQVLVTEPSGAAEQYASGSVVNIAWEYFNVNSVDIYYSFDEVNWNLIVNGFTGTSYNWVYPGGNLGNITYVKVQETPTASIGSFTEVTPVLTIPSLLLPVNGTTGVSVSPTFSWSSVIGATLYNLEVATDAGFGSIIINASGSVTSYTASGLSLLTEYYWRVNASNSLSTSGWSSVFNFTTRSSIPVAPVITLPATGSVGVALNPTIGWSLVPGADSYEIQISSSSIFAGTPSVDVSGITIEPWSSPIQIAADTEFYVRMNATNSAGTSPWSTSVNFQTLYYAPATPLFNSIILTLPASVYSPLLSNPFTNGGNVYAWAGSIETSTTQIYLCKYNASLQTWTNVSSLSINSTILHGTNPVADIYYSSTTPTKFYIEAVDLNTGNNYQCSFTVNYSTNVITLASAFTLTSPSGDAVSAAGIINATNAGITYSAGTGYIEWAYHGENGVYISDAKINNSGGNYCGILVYNNITQYICRTGTNGLAFISIPAYSPV
jgi:hypothetical protein